MLRAENHLRSADVELQQRAVEYIQLSNVASIDVLVSIIHCMLFHLQSLASVGISDCFSRDLSSFEIRFKFESVIQFDLI